MATHFFGLTQRTYQFSHAVGRNEFAGTGFRNPVDFAVDANDNAYIVNRSYENRPDGVRMSICTLDEEYITEFSSEGEGEGQMTWPTSVALDSSGNVYVADEWLNRITVFDKDGEFLRSWGKAGSGDGEMDRPAGIAISPQGTVFISDSRNNRIQKFSLDGAFLGKFGSAGSGHGQLNMPWGIALGKDGSVYVADWRNDRIQVFGSDGEWQASFGESGSGVGQFNRPAGVCVDDDGDIYVADWLNNRLQVLSPDGRFVTEMRGDADLSGWGRDKLKSNPDMIRQRALAHSNNPNFEKDLGHPCAVKIDSHGRICVLDHTRGRIQIYTKSKDPVLV
jgi:sugar lactone lactonase YvrE